MPCIVTTIHDPVALGATCRTYGLGSPAQGSVQHDNMEAFGWIVRLPGINHPVVFDTLTGLVAYHSRDGAFRPYARRRG